MQLPFALPTDNKILIGAAVVGVVILVAIAYFMFFRSSSKAPSVVEEVPEEIPSSQEVPSHPMMAPTPEEDGEEAA